MSGTKYLLDTNFILGLLKSQPEVLAEVSARSLTIGQCAYSAITREEESQIRQKLERLTYLPISRAVEDIPINLRQVRKIKLPDAIIAATALYVGLELLTRDKQLKSVTTNLPHGSGA